MQMKHCFFKMKRQLVSVILRSTPETDYLHHQILNRFGQAGKLEMDHWVFEFFKRVSATAAAALPANDINTLPAAHRLTAVEQAKEYMNRHFASDISLGELATHCCVSPFHFSRIFKTITAVSPHQYLLHIRLKHGEMLLKNSGLPVCDIAYTSGFASAAYFATAFGQKYKMNPLLYRKMNQAG
jgi:AraC family transcriptional regulator